MLYMTNHFDMLYQNLKSNNPFFIIYYIIIISEYGNLLLEIKLSNIIFPLNIFLYAYINPNKLEILFMLHLFLTLIYIYYIYFYYLANINSVFYSNNSRSFIFNVFGKVYYYLSVSNITLTQFLGYSIY